MAIGLLALFHIEFDLNVIAGLMAVIGYSLNDSIVISDRLRDILSSRTKLSIYECSDVAIKATFSRTMITSGTTLFTVGALLLLGGCLVRLRLHAVYRRPGGYHLFYHGSIDRTGAAGTHAQAYQKKRKSWQKRHDLTRQPLQAKRVFGQCAQGALTIGPFVTGVNNKREALCLLFLLAGGYDPVSWPAVYPALCSSTDIGHAMNGTATAWGSGRVPSKRKSKRRIQPARVCNETARFADHFLFMHRLHC